jgi:hypothetical protein
MVVEKPISLDLSLLATGLNLSVFNGSMLDYLYNYSLMYQKVKVI